MRCGIQLIFNLLDHFLYLGCAFDRFSFQIFSFDCLIPFYWSDLPLNYAPAPYASMQIVWYGAEEILNLYLFVLGYALAH